MRVYKHRAFMTRPHYSEAAISTVIAGSDGLFGRAFM